MGYRFKPKESFAKGAARILFEQIDEASEQLSGEKDRQKAVHEARKGMKRARALLRLARPELPRSDFARENARFRDIARMLAGHRDADVMRATLGALRAAAPGSKALERAHVALDRSLPHPAQQSAETTAALFADTLALLGEAREAVRDIAFPDAPVADAATAGVETTYRKGRSDWREVKGAPDHEEAWHEWRKHVQAHWRQMVLLSAAWPQWFAARMEVASNLSDVLGIDHDLYVLKGHIANLRRAGGGEGGLSAADRRRVTAIIEARQEELREQALQLGDLLYARRPKGLVAEATGYWRLVAANPRSARPQKPRDANRRRPEADANASS